MEDTEKEKIPRVANNSEKQALTYSLDFHEHVSSYLDSNPNNIADNFHLL